MGMKWTYFSASGGSFVPDRLMWLSAIALLKNCLKEDGMSLPFLEHEWQIKNINAFSLYVA